MQNLTGIWEGEYSVYDETWENPQEEYHAFKLELNDMAGEISGRCFDLTLNDEPANVHGFHDETGLISFIKKYDRLVFRDEKGNHYGDDGSEHPDINYYGRYNVEENVFEGHWEIQNDEDKVGFQEDFELDLATGQWYMRKVN